MQSITFTSDNDQIVGNLFPAKQPSRLAFLFLHGWFGHQNIPAAKKLAELGYTSMTYGMRGQGVSEGTIEKLTRADFLHDAVLAYDYLRAQVGEETAIGVVGSSFGAYTGTLLTKERPVHCLSLRVPANYPDEGFDRVDPIMLDDRQNSFEAWRQQPLTYSENKALRALHDFTGNVQIVESERDEQVPHQTTSNFVEAVTDPAKLSYHLLANAPHGLTAPAFRTAYIQLLTDWARRQIS